MRDRPSAALWIGSAFGATVIAVIAVLTIFGADRHGTDIALQMTARLSFLLFWPAYAGGPMAALFGPMFQPLKKYAREFGLAFASALFVHLGLVAWRCQIGAVPATSTFIVFGPAVAATYSLTILSIGHLQQAVGRKTLGVLRTFGLNYIAYAFAKDFVNDPLHGNARHMVAYLPFAILAIAGPILRFAVFALRIGHIWRSPPIEPAKYDAQDA